MPTVEDIMSKENKHSEKICCICGEKFRGYGNNPYPVKQSGTCCDYCNLSVVLHARIFGLSVISG